MKNVQAVVEQMNLVRKFMGEKPIDIARIDPFMADTVFREIDTRLSPEALYADGERPKAQANRLRKLYMAAVSELRKEGYVPFFTPYHF